MIKFVLNKTEALSLIAALAYAIECCGVFGTTIASLESKKEYEHVRSVILAQMKGEENE